MKNDDHIFLFLKRIHTVVLKKKVGKKTEREDKKISKKTKERKNLENMRKGSKKRKRANVEKDETNFFFPPQSNRVWQHPYSLSLPHHQL